MLKNPKICTKCTTQRSVTIPEKYARNVVKLYFRFDLLSVMREVFFWYSAELYFRVFAPPLL